ncbi:conserved hypothetical protein [Candidatus Magnetomoraceae bacterium gMMP-1]
MSKNQNKKINIDSKISEAELYHSQGLFQEALDVYKMLLSLPELESEKKKDVKNKISLLKKEVDDENDNQTKIADQLSDADLSIIKGTLSYDNNNIIPILNTASVFKEIGVFKEAIIAYEKLFKFDYPYTKFIPELTSCLLSLYSTDEVLDHIEQILVKQDVSGQKKARIQFVFALVMEKKNLMDLAFNLFKAAEKLDPENTKIKTKLNSLADNSKLLTLPPETTKISTVSPENTKLSSVPPETTKLSAVPPETTKLSAVPPETTKLSAVSPAEVKKDKAESEESQKVADSDMEETDSFMRPEFISAEFSLKSSQHNGVYQLDVLKQSGTSVSLLITENNFDLYQMFNLGDKIKNVKLYAEWAVIRVDVTVKNKNQIKYGDYKEQYLIEIMSKEL